MLFRSDRKSTRLNSSHTIISYAVFCLKKKKTETTYREDRAAVAGVRPGLPAPTPPPRPPTAPPRGSRRSTCAPFSLFFFFFFNDAATPEIYPLSLPDPLPI